MKTTAIVIATFALSVATAYVVAQTGLPAAPPPPLPISTASAPTPYPPPPLHKDPPQGNTAAIEENNVVAQGSAAATQGAQLGSSGMPITPFEMLDRDKAGTLTMDQARTDPWLRQNFTLCDANHDDQVTQSEYVACTTKGQ